MNKTKKLFYCKSCGSESPKWIGQCNSCKEWNTIVEEIIEEIVSMKKSGFSSSSLTALQKNAKERQKWPLLNIVRQILKVYGYLLHPIRKSDGYDETGKKKMKRFFIIKKVNQ